MPRHEVDHAVTDSFRERFDYSKKYKERLAEAREKGEAAVKEVIADPALADLPNIETGLIVDMFLTLRDVKGYAAMIELYDRMPTVLQRTRMVREQYAFALNRLGEWKKATEVIKKVIEEFGASSETNGLLGRVYKDQWEKAKEAKQSLQARGLLREAVEAYSAGFQADWRDAYPGVNAVTLMELMDKRPPEQAEILPVVRYSAAQKAKANGDYWDFATLMELAIIGNEQDEAMRQAEMALTKVEIPWHLETTERNLRLIREARTARGEDVEWIKEFEDALAQKREELTAAQNAQ
jgi:MAP3K TRAFs-binding domain